MKQGIVYAIAGDDQLPKLLMSINALRKVSDIPILIHAYLTEDGYALLNGHPIMRCKNPPSSDLKSISRYLKTRVHKVSPFDVTMYMDNDILPLKDPSWLFKEIPESGVIFGGDAGKTIKKFSAYATPGKSLPDEIKKQFKIDVDPNWKIWNGGLFIFDKRAFPFLDSWHENQMKIIGGMNGWSQRDQGTLIASIWKHKLQDNPILPREANFLHGLHSGLNLKDGVWYNRRSGEQISNLHLCLSWGKNGSETWKEAKKRFYVKVKIPKPEPALPSSDQKLQIYNECIAKLRPNGENVIVIRPGRTQGHSRLASPLQAMVASLNTAPGFQVYDDEQCGSPCVKMGDAFRAHSGWGSVVWVNDKAVYIEYWDHVDVRSGKLSRIKKLIESGAPAPDIVLKCQYRPNHKSYSEFPCKIVPFIYPSVNTHKEGVTYHLDFRKMFKKTVESGKYEHTIFSRLADHKPRRKLVIEAQKVPNSDVALIGLNRGHHQEARKDGRLGKDEYFSRLSKAMFSLDAPGNGACTHRMIETWAMGQPLIMPKQKNQAYVPWEAGKHYIACEHDGKDLVEVAKYYIEHYDEALQIAENGMKYYDDHCSREGIAKLFVHIMKSEGFVSG